MDDTTRQAITAVDEENASSAVQQSPEQPDTMPAERASERPEIREAIINFIVWNQAMEGIPSSHERAEAAYDEALRNRHRIFKR